MLVLSRREKETVVIGGRILVRLNRIRGNKVSIGIEAPGDMQIRRGELFDDFVEDSCEISAAENEPASYQQCLLNCEKL